MQNSEPEAQIKGRKISKKNVEKALDEIDSGGVPTKRHSTVYCLVSRKKHYPPKYVIARACFHRTGVELKHFRGRPQTNNPLHELGYILKKCNRIPDCRQ